MLAGPAVDAGLPVAVHHGLRLLGSGGGRIGA
jgi:hypothetical protein